MANRFTNPIPEYSDVSGNPQSTGELYFYETGTSTPANTYSDAALTTPNSNPIVLNSAGRVPGDVFLDPSVTYRVVLKNAGGTVWTADPVVDPAANVTAAFSVYAGNPNGNVAGNAGTAGGSGASVVWDSANDLLYVCTTTGNAAGAVWTQVAADISGAFVTSGVISPSSLASSQNNYNPTGLANASIIRQDASADVTITGLAGGTSGRLIRIQNISAANTITIVDESASSTAANRFALDHDLVVLPNHGLDFWYDDVSDRWRGVSMPAQSATQAEMEAGTETELRRMSPLRVAQAVPAIMADAAVGSVGSYAFLTPSSIGTYNPGDTMAGSALIYSGIEHANLDADEVSALNAGGGSPVNPSGTWRAMGQGGAASKYHGSLWLRIS